MSLFKTQTRVAMAYTNTVGDKVYPVVVDIKKGIKSTEDIQFMSSDVNTGVLSVAFINGNENFNVSGADVVCSVMRPDASTLELPCEVVRENIVEVPLGINGTSQDGIYSFDFKVFKGENKIVGTPIMNYSVSLSIGNDTVVEEDDRLPVLTVLMTQLTEIKDEAREAINQANTATVASREATINAIEATNNANATINTANQKMLEVDNAKNEMTTTVTTKVNEVETRFNALTASQQQSSEIIDARDGETSLKARLDRDVEKTNKELDKIKKLEESTVSTVETESDFTTVEVTSNGYFEDVKLEGKTLVNHLYNSENTVSSTNASDKKYTALQAGKTYTVIIYVVENSNNKAFYPFRITYSDNAQVNISQSAYPKGSIITHKFEVADKEIGGIWVNWCSTYVDGDVITTKTLLLEGDHTQNPPSYFEGLKSVGQSASEGGADEIVVSSVNENLFDKTQKLVDGYISENPGVYGDVSPHNTCKSTDFILIDSNTTYTLNNDNPIEETCGFYDTTKKCITVVRGNTVTSPSNAKYMRCTIKRSDFEQGFQIVKGTQTIEYTPHQSDKKRLLFYNEETQTWEKPILREWDSIEKHSDGKYYYHQRSGEVVLNGSKDWVYPTSQDGNNTILLYIRISDAKTSQKYPICDRFNGTNLDIWNPITDIEGIIINHNKDCVLRISKSRLSTQDIEGFKKWLQTNNVTVVYQLAQEKVYECTNIDLITYANETNYIVESGAISPKTTLKVHSNISNVVKILQEKVSLLENKFIEGLKQVLAGDMYSLAELLYPEDFVEENLENGIMLLPTE